MSESTDVDLDDDGAPAMRWSEVIEERPAATDEQNAKRKRVDLGLAILWGAAPIMLVGIARVISLPASTEDLFLAVVGGTLPWLAVGAIMCVATCWSGPTVKSLFAWTGAFLLGIFGVQAALNVPKEWMLPVAVRFAWEKHRVSCLELDGSVFEIPGDADSRWSGAFVRSSGTNADGTAHLVVDWYEIDAPRGSQRHTAGSERIVDDSWTCHAEGEWWYVCWPR